MYFIIFLFGVCHSLPVNLTTRFDGKDFVVTMDLNILKVDLQSRSTTIRTVDEVTLNVTPNYGDFEFISDAHPEKMMMDKADKLHISLKDRRIKDIKELKRKLINFEKAVHSKLIFEGSLTREFKFKDDYYRCDYTNTDQNTIDIECNFDRSSIERQMRADSDITVDYDGPITLQHSDETVFV